MTLELNDAVSGMQWESSTPEIVSASEGVVSALTPGDATVADVTICANADEIVTVNPEKTAYDDDFATVSSVLNVADADYSTGNVFPLYRAFGRSDASFKPVLCS